MERIEIKLKECCLTCEHFSPDGVIGFGMCPLDGKRVIACGHMPVCQRYIIASGGDKNDELQRSN